MSKLLMVVDMQNDFVDGVLGSEAAQRIVPNVCKKIEDFKRDSEDYDNNIIVTLDTHDEYQGVPVELQRLPMHCKDGEHGWKLNQDVLNTLNRNGRWVPLYKDSFMGIDAASKYYRDRYEIDMYDTIEIVGLCTDICVVSNALMCRAMNPTARIIVDASCCAGTSVEAHKAALTVMKSCLIDVLNEE